MPANGLFDAFFQLQILPGPGGDPFVPELFFMQPFPGAPTGFEQVEPFAMGEVGLLLPGDPFVDSFFDIF